MVEDGAEVAYRYSSQNLPSQILVFIWHKDWIKICRGRSLPSLLPSQDMTRNTCRMVPHRMSSMAVIFLACLK